MTTAPTPRRVYYATVERWIDADTVVVVVDQGFDDMAREHLRLKDCWAVALGDPGGLDAKFAVEAIAPVGTRVVVETFRDRGETLARYVAHVWLPNDTETIAETLIKFGYATRERKK